MNTKTSKLSTFIMFVIFGSILLAFLGGGGTGDAQYFMGWIENAEEYGIIDGFRENYDMYPPYSALVLYLVYRLFIFVPNAALFSIRICTAVFMIISCVVAKLIFKNDKMVYIFFLTTFLSVTNGYLDIFIVPFALMAYYFFKMDKYFWGGLFLCLMCLMKYQPLIVMPIVAAGFVNINREKKNIIIKWEKIIKICIGAIIPLIVTFAIYKKPFFWSIYVALFRDSSFIAPNGLNFGWIVQFLYEKVTGTLVDNRVDIMWSVPFKALVAFKFVFVLGYIVVLVQTLFAIGKSVTYILKNSFIVYILYYLFNTNVHENHFFVGVLLAVLLYHEVGEDFFPFLCAAAFMFNMNVAVFYGVWGITGGFDRVILGVLDPTIVLAFVNVIFGVVMIWKIERSNIFDNALKEQKITGI